MSGSAAARGPRPPCGGIRSPACPAASGYQTLAGGGTLPFEEAEGTRLLLRYALADMLRVNAGEKNNRLSRGEAFC